MKTIIAEVEIPYSARFHEVLDALGNHVPRGHEAERISFGKPVWECGKCRVIATIDVSRRKGKRA